MNDVEKKYYESMWNNSVVASSTGCRSISPAKAVEEMLSSVPQSTYKQIALDLGCGIGRHTELLIKQNYFTVGMDFAFSAVKNPNLPSAQYIQGDACYLPFQNSSIDLILDSGCLHHIHTSNYKNYADEVKRIIKPSGHLILYQFKERNGKMENWEGKHFTKYFGEEELKNLFDESWKFVKFKSVLGETGKEYWAALLQKLV